jgi:hypothetical protein
MDNVKIQELKQLESKIERQLLLMNHTKFRSSKRRTTSKLINEFHVTYLEYKEKGGNVETIKAFANINLFLKQNLSYETYEQRIATLFSNYNFIDYKITNTLNFSRWDIAVSQLQNLLTKPQFEEITIANRSKKHFFYDSDFYVVYDHLQQAFGVGREYKRKNEFDIFTE